MRYRMRAVLDSAHILKAGCGSITNPDEVLDALLDVLGHPSSEVMAAVDTKIHPTWLVRQGFDAMIRAIKDGK